MVVVVSAAHHDAVAQSESVVDGFDFHAGPSDAGFQVFGVVHLAVSVGDGGEVEAGHGQREGCRGIFLAVPECLHDEDARAVGGQGLLGALQDADILLYVTDMVETPDKNQEFLDRVSRMSVPVIVLINKIDLSNPEALQAKVDEWHGVLPKAEIMPISALHRFGVEQLLKRIGELLPESPAYFDKDQWTDKPARFFVTEIIREKILLYYDKEIPYSVEVAVEQFKESERSIHINAVIYVERDSQKGIIIGHQGVAIKRVSSEARKSLEKFFGKSIYLETFVKVDKDWRQSSRAMKQFGYDLKD